ncbi:C3a anaphylatoxin chemotactic receptor [Carassius gibelio]|uniref:C3a anaphylatoxin chemotactic receptor n=1 Tax=Carassius gibelio TaxID=101364 RepID=UPI0022788B5E|nr:C3a anaphylatoxin chemotactic receptor [Carassius gibelio]
MENTSFEAQNMTRVTAHPTTIQIVGMIFLACILIATIVVGLIGNGLVIFLTGCRMKTTVNSILFLNLAIADFTFLLSTVLNLFLILAQSQLGKITNKLFSFIYRLNLFASIFFLVVISLDRCLCTWLVVWARNKRTTLKAKIICIIVWVSSIGFSIPFFTVHMFTLASLVTYHFTVGFLIPFLIIASSYTAIGVRIKRLKGEKHLRTYRGIITVTLAFFICWFPSHVCHLYAVTAVGNNWSEVLLTAMIVCFCLVYLNSCLNPILYVFMCDDYKKKLKQSLLLVLETAFAEDHLDFKADAKERGHENSTELLDM